MNGSQELKIGFCLVKVFRFGGELMLYLVVFDVNIPYRQTEVFIFLMKNPQTPMK